MNITDAQQLASRAYKKSIFNRQTAELEARRKAHEAAREYIEQFYSNAQWQIRRAAELGNYSVKIYVPSFKVGEEVSQRLRKVGFNSRAYDDTVAVGVDEWENRYVVEIHW